MSTPRHSLGVPPRLECSRCGYDLRGLAQGAVCPECGQLQSTAGVHDGVVIDDVPCLKCGYSLAGLRADGRCPECGSDIARSLQGNLLVYSSAQFVRRLVIGATCVLWGLAVFCLWIVCQILPIGRAGLGSAPLVALGLVSVLASALGLAGWWFLSSPDPALVGQDRAINARRVLRIALLASMTCFVAGMLAQWMIGGSIAAPPLRATPLAGGWTKSIRTAMWVAYGINTCVWPVKTLASLLYVRSLAARIPSLTLASRARFLARCAILGAVLALALVGVMALASILGARGTGSGMLFLLPLCGGFAGILVWCLLYATMIGSLRSSLAGIARVQAILPGPA